MNEKSANMWNGSEILVSKDRSFLNDEDINDSNLFLSSQTEKLSGRSMSFCTDASYDDDDDSSTASGLSCDVTCHTLLEVSESINSQLSDRTVLQHDQNSFTEGANNFAQGLPPKPTKIPYRPGASPPPVMARPDKTIAEVVNFPHFFLC